MRCGDEQPRREKPGSTANSNDARLSLTFFLVEVPCNAHRGMGDRRGIETRCLDARARHDKNKDEKQGLTHDAPPVGIVAGSGREKTPQTKKLAARGGRNCD